MYWKRPKPLWMWPHWAKVIWSCIENVKHKIYYNDNYFWSIFSHIFFRGRLHLKINCANNKLTCEGKRRLIKMSRSQLFLIVSCFVSNSNSNIFPSGQTRLSFHQSQSDPNIPPIHFIIMPGILIEDQRKAFFFNILLCDNLFTKHCIPFFGNFQDMFFFFYCPVSETPLDPNFGSKLGLVWVWVGEPD